METTTATTSGCAAEARNAVRPPDLGVTEWGYYKAAIGWKCTAEVQLARRRAAESKLADAEKTIELAQAIVQAPPPPADGWSDLEMGVGLGLALVLGAAAASAAAWAATR